MEDVDVDMPTLLDNDERPLRHLHRKCILLMVFEGSRAGAFADSWFTLPFTYSLLPIFSKKNAFIPQKHVVSLFFFCYAFLASRIFF